MQIGFLYFMQGFAHESIYINTLHAHTANKRYIYVYFVIKPGFMLQGVSVCNPTSVLNLLPRFIDRQRPLYK